MPSDGSRTPGGSAEDVRAAIEGFLRNSRQPALLEPGEELLPIAGGNVEIAIRGSRLTLQAWDRTRNIVRRVNGVREQTAARLELVVERFARREGRMFLLDLARPASHDAARRSTRLVFREQFRRMLSRAFADWTVAEVSADADLEHSLSPAYPRAFLHRGQQALAAIAGPPADTGDPDGALTFGLIWLDYLRSREKRRNVGGVAVFVPSGCERTTCLRVNWLNPDAARYLVFSYSADGFAVPVDVRDFGNLDTRLEACRRPVMRDESALQALASVPGVEQVPKNDGAISFRVRGLEFARAVETRLLFGVDERRTANAHNLGEIVQLGRELARSRSPEAADRMHPLYQRCPEAWLESKVRAEIGTIDATLLPDPVYGQVPAFAGGERGVIDLLAADRSGGLAVLELKASEDIHLPLQAVDYWMRVKWHAERNEFSERGYFPGLAMRREAPRLLLVSPALEFHPSNETVLGYFSPSIPVERIGVGVEWRKRLEVMFRFGHLCSKP